MYEILAILKNGARRADFCEIAHGDNYGKQSLNVLFSLPNLEVGPLQEFIYYHKGSI